jgi:hypothetical protein
LSVIDQIYDDRLDDLKFLRKKPHWAKFFVEDLYPDNAHFIYELLQNAEDVGAKNAYFRLSRDHLEFEHDGLPFNERDVIAITEIGKGTKENDVDTIGRFGLGFKAVFAYTQTPHIWSPTYSFKISELVLPNEIDACPAIGNKTRFQFPFNNPKKPPELAFDEIETALNQIAETTLLFLSNLESIEWHIEGGASGEVLKIKHSEHHFENLKNTESDATTSTHFLKFDQAVKGLSRQVVSVAFALDFLPKCTAFDGKIPLAQQLKIVPAEGNVAVFFPAEKETSGLRFHLHAPFVPELSRASIKETPVNRPLFLQLASLAAKSLHEIRDLSLLTGDFLAALPNPKDQIPERYDCIRKAIILEMQTQALTPTFSGSHASASQLLQAERSLKELLSEDDLATLIEDADQAPMWAIAAQQKNSDADRFLVGLEIKEWGVEEFVELLEAETTFFYEENDFAKWLSSKSSEWHQQLYSFLLKEDHSNGYFWSLKNASIIRLSNGTYSKANDCYFPDETDEWDENLPRVDRKVFTSGKSKLEQESAKKLLEALGVRQVGEAEEIEAILKKRYVRGNLKPLAADLNRFVALFEKDPNKAALFKPYLIFETTKDGHWNVASEFYIDAPYMDTGLDAWYESPHVKTKKERLNARYLNCGINPAILGKFAKAIGVTTELSPATQCCSKNPQWDYLGSVKGERWTSGINSDYLIPDLEQVLATQSLAISKLAWRTMGALSPKYLIATYQKNTSNGARYAPSQLVHSLKKMAWVPQKDGGLVRPTDATSEQLPPGFPYDSGAAWLNAVEFGQTAIKRSEAHRTKETFAKYSGFKNVQDLEEAKWLIENLSAEEIANIREEKNRKVELPHHEPSNPERRTERVGQLALEAPERDREERVRTVAIGQSPIKEQANTYLRQQYTNSDGVMICQICQDELPFSMPDSSYYFEKIQFLQSPKKLHYQNHLALCPNHAAMFHHANDSKDMLDELFADIASDRIDVILANKDAAIYFTQTHLTDLRAILNAEQSLATQNELNE